MLRKLVLFTIGLLYIHYLYASPLGVSFTYPLMTKDPKHLNGYQSAISYFPSSLIWQQVQIYFDGSYGHWWVSSDTIHRNLSIYAIAPYLRYYLIKKDTFSPYFEASIGLAYLTKTRLDDRNLGMHFAFQDQVGLGIAYGPEQRLYATFSAWHYSNASLCSNNAGITAPWVLTIGYRF